MTTPTTDYFPINAYYTADWGAEGKCTEADRARITECGVTVHSTWDLLPPTVRTNPPDPAQMEKDAVRNYKELSECRVLILSLQNPGSKHVGSGALLGAAVATGKEVFACAPPGNPLWTHHFSARHPSVRRFEDKEAMFADLALWAAEVRADIEGAVRDLTAPLGDEQLKCVFQSADYDAHTIPESMMRRGVRVRFEKATHQNLACDVAVLAPPEEEGGEWTVVHMVEIKRVTESSNDYLQSIAGKGSHMLDQVRRCASIGPYTIMVHGPSKTLSRTWNEFQAAGVVRQFECAAQSFNTPFAFNICHEKTDEAMLKTIVEIAVNAYKGVRALRPNAPTLTLSRMNALGRVMRPADADSWNTALCRSFKGNGDRVLAAFQARFTEPAQLTDLLRPQQGGTREEAAKWLQKKLKVVPAGAPVEAKVTPGVAKALVLMAGLRFADDVGDDGAGAYAPERSSLYRCMKV